VGHLVNANAYRLGYSRKWVSSWVENSKLYKKYLQEDFIIFRFIKLFVHFIRHSYLFLCIFFALLLPRSYIPPFLSIHVPISCFCPLRLRRSCDRRRFGSTGTGPRILQHLASTRRPPGASPPKVGDGTAAAMAFNHFAAGLHDALLRLSVTPVTH